MLVRRAEAKKGLDISSSLLSSLESSASTIFRVATWMDWWMGPRSGYWDRLTSEDSQCLKKLQVLMGRCMDTVAKQGIYIYWNNLMLAHRDAYMAKFQYMPSEQMFLQQCL